MNKFLFQRICATLLVISFITALPLQGMSTAAYAESSQISWADNAEIATQDTCERCGTMPVMNMACPTFYCVSITGIVVETPEFARQMPDGYLFSVSSTVVGLSIAPDPYPPRFSI